MTSASAQLISRRKHERHTFMRPSDWDFFSEPSGPKPGFIENISTSGLLLCTSEAIDYRRWLRLIVREPHQNLWFTLVGRVVRREDRMEAWQDQQITLYRYGIELIHPLNPLVLERLQDHSLRSACHNLLTPSLIDTPASGGDDDVA